MIARRNNKIGMIFHLIEDGDTTRVVCRGKTVIYPMNSAEMSQRWYNWQILGASIQSSEAFGSLSDDLREFLMTGITPEEWNETFKEKEE